MDNDLPRSFDCILHPLTPKCSVEVAFQLMDIFLLLGAPSIHQSDNGSEFTVQVITELKTAVVGSCHRPCQAPTSLQLRVCRESQL